VPRAFPGEPLAEQEAHELVVGALAALADRYGVPLDELERRGWIVRGGRVWMHEASEWPLDAWSEGAWRAVSIGLRAVELDSRGRPRPTNDFLRWLGRRVSRARVDLSAEALASLLGGTARPAPDAPPGPLALGLEGAVVGRGVATPTGLVSEIPKARAADLRRILDASAP
jgi:hypothetical protein